MCCYYFKITSSCFCRVARWAQRFSPKTLLRLPGLKVRVVATTLARRPRPLAALHLFLFCALSWVYSVLPNFYDSLLWSLGCCASGSPPGRHDASTRPLEHVRRRRVRRRSLEGPVRAPTRQSSSDAVRLRHHRVAPEARGADTTHADLLVMLEMLTRLGDAGSAGEDPIPEVPEDLSNGLWIVPADKCA